LKEGGGKKKKEERTAGLDRRERGRKREKAEGPGFRGGKGGKQIREKRGAIERKEKSFDRICRTMSPTSPSFFWGGKGGVGGSAVPA